MGRVANLAGFGDMNNFPDFFVQSAPSSPRQGRLCFGKEALGPAVGKEWGLEGT